MTKYYFAFKYHDGFNTTMGTDYKRAGEVLVFKTKIDRDNAVDKKSRGGTWPATRKEISKLGHGYFFKKLPGEDFSPFDAAVMMLTCDGEENKS